MSAPPTVVVPCAGKGRRLGLPFPKELIPSGPGRLAIDSALQLVDEAAAADLRLLLVTGPGREATARYVRGRCAAPVAVVGQDPALPELAGAIRSALPWCPGPVLVLLPDQVLAHPAPGLLDAALAALAGHQACFLAAPESDPRRIAVDGALATTPGEDSPNGARRLTGLADKPGPGHTEGFDRVWFGFGFQPTAAHAVLEQLHAATEHRLTENDFRTGPLAGAPVLDCPPFTDLGTWPAYAHHWKDTPCD
ncbi:hypothetical protein GCM10018781_60950 [Kitasatospora indigofera]|uniref:MobA-like NTP transferase domain-containing protein n=1 Tax=Kitasatospora indigofera TaxID=67307 RepID=A0A919L2J7_9ACTN|nr:NTP transferase domain-containing protein [Kitasatospora indigofera]GHH80471.1 hypothetical protein GCM10018781_60950 [Kitasatospora indigofera]